MYLCAYFCRWLDDKFSASDKGRDGILTLPELVILLNKLNIAADTDSAKTVFEVRAEAL